MQNVKILNDMVAAEEAIKTYCVVSKSFSLTVLI